MFDADFAHYLIQIRLPQELWICARWIVERARPEGIIGLSPEKLSGESGFPLGLVLDTLKAMEGCPPLPLLRREPDRLVLDYPERDVEYVRHFRNALSNAQWFFDPDKI